jgi:hypothetical protein
MGFFLLSRALDLGGTEALLGATFTQDRVCR